MFSVAILMCLTGDPSVSTCTAFISPTLAQESECSGEFLRGMTILRETVPNREMVNAVCIDWSTGEVIPQDTKINY